MPTAEITVQYRNEKQPGRKMGSIKSSEGDYYGCPDALLFQFQRGEVCTVEYSETPKRDGNGSWKTITKKIGVAKAPPLAAPPRQRTNPVDNEHIFITALLKEFIGVGKIELATTEIVTAVNAIRDAYRHTLGGLEKQRSDSMDDEVPY